MTWVQRWRVWYVRQRIDRCENDGHDMRAIGPDRVECRDCGRREPMPRDPVRDILNTRISLHHTARVRDSPACGGRVVRPIRARWWTQRQVERICGREVGHCWHADRAGYVDWWCCVCSADVDGWPDQRCLLCALTDTNEPATQ